MSPCRYIVRMTRHGRNIEVLSPGQQVIEAEHGRPAREIVGALYLDEGLSQAEIARRLGVHRLTLVRWMREWGIPTRSIRGRVA